MTSLPGWTTKIDETSNGVFKVTLTDNFGRKAEVIDAATDDTIKKAYQDAFDIEKQVSKNWNKFLYDFCITQLADITIKTKNYNDKAFGSWLIEINDSRIVYMGKDFWLVAQAKKDNQWFDMAILKKEELTYSLLLTIINLIRPKFRTI
jgi:DNA mismatch repair ATPase MutS